MPPNLVMIHGANGSAATLGPLSGLLARDANLLVPDWPGHGGRELPATLDIPLIARDVLARMDEQGMRQAAFFGYSMGGMVALYLARHFPARVQGLALLATKVVFDANAVSHLQHLSDPERIRRVDPTRPETLRQRHAPQSWEAVLAQNRAMFAETGQMPPLTGHDLPRISTPALVISGLQDQLVGPDETREIARLLRGHLLMFAGPAHPLELVPLPQVAQKISDWLAGLPPPAAT